MSWLEYHQESEQLASEAEIAAHRGNIIQAREIYLKAAQAEEKAIGELESDKPRTYGITAVSAASLYFKAAEWQVARNLAHRYLGSGQLPKFAYLQLEELLDTIKTQHIGVDLDAAHILISIMGGEMALGGGPLDLIVAKEQSIKSLVFRTIEHLLNIPHRKRGEPSKEIRESYKPWVFQAAPGSYRFAVLLQETKQLNRLNANDMSAKHIIDTSFGILQACVESPQNELIGMVPDESYRKTFLEIARDLAPSAKEKRFIRIDITAGNGDNSVVLVHETREAINSVIKENALRIPDEKETKIRGVLRALHLDSDWIEVVNDSGSWRITDVKEQVDDRIGSMVNQLVAVYAVQVGNTTRFINIEIDDQQGDDAYPPIPHFRV